MGALPAPCFQPAAVVVVGSSSGLARTALRFRSAESWSVGPLSSSEELLSEPEMLSLRPSRRSSNSASVTAGWPRTLRFRLKLWMSERAWARCSATVLLVILQRAQEVEEVVSASCGAVVAVVGWVSSGVAGWSVRSVRVSRSSGGMS
jgi:hypothetical protein